MINRTRKITAINLTQSCCLSSLSGSQSYNRIATNIDDCINTTISKQAVSKKISLEFDNFLVALIEEILSNIYATNKNNKIKSFFTRVLVQDSTVIKLPLRLFNEMSGASNKTTQVANARIQVVYDLASERFIKFEIESYSKNDLKAAPELELQENDLCLRDRGYLTSNEIIRHISSNAFFIYRHKFDFVYLNKDTRKPIDLLDMLKKKQRIDIEVRLNSSPETIVRLVAEPINTKLANERIRKAKKENKNLSKKYLKMLEWSIYLTNLDMQFTFQDIFGMYSLRWKIETIFKNWKSNLNFDNIHNVSSTQLRILLHSRFLLIILIHNIHSLIKPIIKKKYNKDISFIRLTIFLTDSLFKIERILSLLKENAFEKSIIIKSIKQKCSYDKRADRTNFEESLAIIFN